MYTFLYRIGIVKLSALRYNVLCFGGSMKEFFVNVKQSFKGMTPNEAVLLILTFSIFLTVYAEIAALILPLRILGAFICRHITKRRKDLRYSDMHRNDFCIYRNDIYNLYHDSKVLSAYFKHVLRNERTRLYSRLHTKIHDRRRKIFLGF